MTAPEVSALLERYIPGLRTRFESWGDSCLPEGAPGRELAIVLGAEILIQKITDSFSELDPITARLILHKMTDDGSKTMKALAAEHGLSGAAAHDRLKHAKRRHPWIQNLFSFRTYRKNEQP